MAIKYNTWAAKVRKDSNSNKCTTVRWMELFFHKTSRAVGIRRRYLRLTCHLRRQRTSKATQTSRSSSPSKTSTTTYPKTTNATTWASKCAKKISCSRLSLLKRVSMKSSGRSDNFISARRNKYHLSMTNGPCSSNNLYLPSSSSSIKPHRSVFVPR